jgi:hypothetical protein
MTKLVGRVRSGRTGSVAALVLLAHAAGVHAQTITAGGGHTCVDTPSGDLKCWGSGTRGVLGSGGTASLGDEPDEMGDALTVVALGAGRRAVQVSAGYWHTCVVLDNGDVKCWGSGSNGRLGSGGTARLGDDPTEMGDALTAVALGAGRRAVQLSAGYAHTCAVLDNGDLKCWGQGAYGRLGSGSGDDLGDQPDEMGDALTAVALGAGRRAVQISAGYSHTCAVLYNGELKCWGQGSDGRLGSGGIQTLGDQPDEMGDFLVRVLYTSTESCVAVGSVGPCHWCPAWQVPFSDKASVGSIVETHGVRVAVTCAGTSTEVDVACNGFGVFEPPLECASVCGLGEEASAELAGCVPCYPGNVSTGDDCEPCTKLGQRANDQRSACENCLPGTEPTADHSNCTACAGNEYSLTGICQVCPPPNVVLNDGTGCGASQCSTGRTCPMDRQCATDDDCVPCHRGNVSTGGDCEPCTKLGQRANDQRSACEDCRPGTEPTADRSNCTACAGNEYSLTGICQACPASQSPNADHTACVACPEGIAQTSVDGVCTCNEGYYNTSHSARCAR